MNVAINALRADSRIRSQDRGRRGARPARRAEGERIAVTNPVCWIFTAASRDRTKFGPIQYFDVFRPSSVKDPFNGALHSDRRRGRKSLCARFMKEQVSRAA